MGGGRSTDHLLGTVIAGRYTLTDVIGNGAMGKVYRARHVFLHNDVAIKIMHPHLCGHRQYLDRFLREARAAAGVEHDNVMSVNDFGELPGGSAFFAMELLRGEDLSHVLEREGRLTWERARHLVVQIVRGLAAVHAAGVVHRDVKPANCFLTDDGQRVKIIDFGIAKLDPTSFDPTQHRTLVGTVMGTPYYMSPEQALGQPVDGRTDIYAVGVLLYRMLTGRVPFVGSAQEVRRQHITSVVPSPSQAAGVRLPPPVERLILEATAKEPDDRFENMRAFERAIMAAWTAGETVNTEAGRSMGAVSPTLIIERAPGVDVAQDQDDSPPTQSSEAADSAEEVQRSVGAVSPTRIWVADNETNNRLPAVREPPASASASKSSSKAVWLVASAVAVALAVGAWWGRAARDATASADDVASAGFDVAKRDSTPDDVMTVKRGGSGAAKTEDGDHRVGLADAAKRPVDTAADSARGAVVGSPQADAEATTEPRGHDPNPPSDQSSDDTASSAKSSRNASRPAVSKGSRSGRSTETKRTLTTGVIERMVAGVHTHLTVCSEHAAGGQPLVRVKFTIAEEGGLVQSPKAVGEHAGTSLGKCVAEVIGKRLRFPASDRTQEFVARVRVR